MPIMVALFALIALVYGAVRAFDALEASSGLGAAVGVAVVAALLAIAALVDGWRRRKEVAPNIRDGDWTHELKGSWGAVRFAAGKRLCEIRVGAQQGAYIFADLLGAEARGTGGESTLAVKVKDPRQGEWLLPMTNERQVRRWQRIFLLAMDQKL